MLAPYSALVPEEKPLDTEVDAPIVSLVDIAVNETLAICAGAGISRCSDLPDGKELARLLHARFDGHVSGYSCDDPDNLVAVAEAAASLRGGLEAVQRIAVQVARFDSARPNRAHVLLGLLVAEGAVTLLLTNWDDCVERSRRSDEQLPAARNAVEVEALRGQVILKVHGCCTEVSTLLITRAQLERPGLWVETRFEAELARSTMVFVGIGDIAGYAQLQIKRLAELVEPARVRVVSLSIDEGWDESAWRGVLPDLAQEHRLPISAEDFFDQLAREWVMGLVRSVRQDEQPDLRACLEAVSAAFVKFTAAEACSWLRRAAIGWAVGESVARSAEAETALEAIAVLASRVADSDVLPDAEDARTADEQPAGQQLRLRPTAEQSRTATAQVQFARASTVFVDDSRIEVMLCKPRQAATAVEAAALERARGVASRLGPQAEVTVLCSAPTIRGPIRTRLEAIDVVDPDAPIDDQIDGPRQVGVNLILADELLRAA